jgi:Tol biopolymer transport system component
MVRTSFAAAIGLAALAYPVLPLVGAGAAEPPGELVLVSTSASGEPGNGLSSFGLSTSADGRYVAFASMATNLSPSDTDQVVDVYVKDLTTGAVTLASQTAEGIKGNAISVRPSISADGQRVAFLSAADNLSPDDTDGYSDVLVKDLRTGQVTVASRTEDGTKAVGGADSATLSADGLAVGFSSNAMNLSPEATDGESHIYLKRLDSGTLTLVDGGTIARPDEQGGASAPSLSADGWVVAFVTDAGGLDPTDTDQRADVYVRDLRSGEIRLASVNAAGVKGDLPSTGPSLSADGGLVAFETSSGNLVPDDTDDGSDVYVKNVAEGALQLASTDASGANADRSAGYPSLSPDGRFVAFSSDATNLGLPSEALAKQIYRKDLESRELVPVSVTADGQPGDYLSIEPSITAGGAVVAFVSPSTNLVPDGDNRVADVFARQFVEQQSPPDTTPPTVEVTVPPSVLRPIHGRQEVEIAGSASDDGGIDRVVISMTDEYDRWEPVIEPVDGAGQQEVSWERTVIVATSLWRGDEARSYDITVTAKDLAGNVKRESRRMLITRS